MVTVLGGTALAGAAWVAAQVPLPPESPQAQTTILYDASGAQLAVLHGGENRVPVTLDQVPKVLQDAVIAAEDRKFFRHRGLDPWGIARATWADVRRQALQGGSTITQQYVKNAYLNQQRTLSRKVKEAVIAVKLERKYDKREILERYLNTIYLGRGAYGVQAAAKAYFGRDVGQLGLREAAYLAGLIRTPVVGDVASDPRLAAERRSWVLRGMEETGAITRAQRAEVERIPVGSYVVAPRRGATDVTSAGKSTEYFVDYVRRQLVDRFGEQQVLRGGLRVRTTLDLRIQEQAYNAVYGLLDRPADPGAALVALDPDGRVVAMVGGRDWAASKVNLAVGREGGGGGRQGGSAFKPFVLAETVREGYTVESSFPGPPKIILPKADAGKDWEVSNFEDESFGRVNLIEATALSVNTVYAQLVTAIGPARVRDMAGELGIDRERLQAVPSIALGTQEVSVLEMAGAYLTFANEGVHVQPSVIRSVSLGGRELPQEAPRRVRVLERSKANVVNFVLRQVVERGTGVAAQLPGNRGWGKTGTTEDYGDAWFVGYTPKLTAAVWMGYPQGQSRPLLGIHGVAKVNGGSLPAMIFQRFMSKATAGDRSTFPVPSDFPGRVLGARVPFGEPTTTTGPGTGSTTTTAAARPAQAPPSSTATPRPTATTRPQPDPLIDLSPPTTARRPDAADDRSPPQTRSSPTTSHRRRT